MERVDADQAVAGGSGRSREGFDPPFGEICVMNCRDSVTMPDGDQSGTPASGHGGEARSNAGETVACKWLEPKWLRNAASQTAPAATPTARRDGGVSRCEKKAVVVAVAAVRAVSPSGR